MRRTAVSRQHTQQQAHNTSIQSISGVCCFTLVLLVLPWLTSCPLLSVKRFKPVGADTDLVKDLIQRGVSDAAAHKRWRRAHVRPRGVVMQDSRHLLLLDTATSSHDEAMLIIDLILSRVFEQVELTQPATSTVSPSIDAFASNLVTRALVAGVTEVRRIQDKQTQTPIRLFDFDQDKIHSCMTQHEVSRLLHVSKISLYG